MVANYHFYLFINFLLLIVLRLNLWMFYRGHVAQQITPAWAAPMSLPTSFVFVDFLYSYDTHTVLIIFSIFYNNITG